MGISGGCDARPFRHLGRGPGRSADLRHGRLYRAFAPGGHILRRGIRRFRVGHSAGHPRHAGRSGHGFGRPTHGQTRRGRPGHRLRHFGLLFRRLIGVAILLVLAEPISTFGLAFGEREYCALGILALTAVAQLSGKSMAKGLFPRASGCFWPPSALTRSTASPGSPLRT